MNTDNMLAELNALVKQAEEKAKNPASQIGGSVVEGMVGQVGEMAKAKNPNKEVDLDEADANDKNVGKGAKYPAPKQTPPSATSGHEKLAMFNRLKSKLMGVLNTQNPEPATIQKSASYELGAQAAQTYLNQLLKQAQEEVASEEGMSSGSLSSDKAYKGDMASSPVGELVPDSDPHVKSDNNNPSFKPGQPKSEAAAPAGEGADPSPEEVIKKAELFLALEKAASERDAQGLIVAKANILDYLNGN